MKTVATKEPRRKAPSSVKASKPAPAVKAGKAASAVKASKAAPAVKAGEPASPKPTPRKTTPVAAPAAVAVQAGPAHEDLVREAAYLIYERSGRVGGRELENWLQAEAMVLRLGDDGAPPDDPSAD